MSSTFYALKWSVLLRTFLEAPNTTHITTDLYALKWSVLLTTFLEAPNTTHITTDLIIVSRVVYIRYLGLIFPKASGKRATDLLDA